MPRLSMNEMTTLRWSFEEDVQQYRAAGISAIGVWRRKLSDFGERARNRIAARLRTGGIQFIVGRRIHGQ